MVAAEVATYSGGNTEVILIVAPSLVVKPKATVVLQETECMVQPTITTNPKIAEQ